MSAEKVIRSVPFADWTYLECGCSSTNHLVRLRFEENDREWGPSLDLELVSPVRTGFWQRLRSFLRGDDCCYLGFDAVITRRSAEQLRDVADRFLRALDKSEAGK